MYFGAVTFNARFPAEIAVFPAFTELWVVAIGASTVVVFLHSPVVTEVEVLVPPGVVPPSSVPEVEFNKLAVAVMDNDGLFPVVSTAEFVKEIFMEALALKLFTVIVPSSSVTPVGSVPVLFRREPFHVSSKPDISCSVRFVIVAVYVRLFALVPATASFCPSIVTCRAAVPSTVPETVTGDRFVFGDCFTVVVFVTFPVTSFCSTFPVTFVPLADTVREGLVPTEKLPLLIKVYSLLAPVFNIPTEIEVVEPELSFTVHPVPS